jgi:glycosyltransferase involved in cell wall biosynthesis
MADSGALTGLSIVYFGNDWFAENRTSSHHIARRLAQRFPVLYVESPGLRAPKANTRDLRKIRQKLVAAAQPPRQIGERMWHTTVPQIPFRGLPLVTTVNPIIGALLLRRATRSLGFERTLSWFLAPDAGELAGRLGERMTVYYCTDNYSSFPGVNRQEVARLDRHLTTHAHQVFVSSPTLLEEKRALNPHTEVSPHGVDAAMFRQASDPNFPAAEATRGLARPVIGFFGLIEAWIDLDLVTALAKARPQWTFLMIGRVAVKLGEIKHLPNVVFAGPQPYESLAQWARSFDVAMIPYLRNQQVMNANPLKLREYLATGKPVVSVHTPEVERFAQHVRIAANAEEFLAQIEAALTDDTEAARVARMESIAGMSWDARVEWILSVVSRRYAETQGRA